MDKVEPTQVGRTVVRKGIENAPPKRRAFKKENNMIPVTAKQFAESMHRQIDSYTKNMKNLGKEPREVSRADRMREFLEWSEWHTKVHEMYWEETLERGRDLEAAYSNIERAIAQLHEAAVAEYEDTGLGYTERMVIAGESVAGQLNAFLDSVDDYERKGK